MPPCMKTLPFFHAALPQALAAVRTPVTNPRVAVLLPKAWRDDALLLDCLRQASFARVLVFTGTDPALAARLPQAEGFDVLPETLQSLLQSATDETVHIIHLGDESAYAQCQNLVQAWQGAGAAERGAALPVVLVRRGKLDAAEVEPKMGAGVASAGITRGLVADAPGRYRLHWLTAAEPDSERGRLYLYPYGPIVGQGMDETDFAGLPALLKDDKIDLMCNLSPALGTSVGARALWARKAIPVVGMSHSLHAARLSTEVMLMLLSGPTFAYDALVSPTHSGARAISQLLDAVAGWLAERTPTAPRFRGQVAVVPYGIDVHTYADPDTAGHRAALGWPAEEKGPVLLFVGRLDKHEKADLLPLLVALGALHRQNHPATLVLAGAGRGYASRLRNLALQFGLAAHVRVLENVSVQDKVHLYGAADICVALSDNIQETYGLTVLEAMAAAKPVVAAAWDGYRELVIHDQTGYLVPTYSTPVAREALHVQRLAEGPWGYGHRDLHESVAVDVGALVQALLALLDNPARCREMGQLGQRHCGVHHAQARQSRALGDLLLRLVGEARKTAWEAPRWLPYVDDVNQRFAHYPSGGPLQDSVRLGPSPVAQDAAGCALVTDCMQLAGKTERNLHDAIVRTVLASPGITVGALAAQLGAGAERDAPAVRLRIVRCLKVGLLQRI